MSPPRVRALLLALPLAAQAGALASQRPADTGVAARVPGGRRFLPGRFLHGLRENSGRHDWLDTATEDGYARPVLDHADRVAAMGMRLTRAVEPEVLSAAGLGHFLHEEAPATVARRPVAPHPARPAAVARRERGHR